MRELNRIPVLGAWKMDGIWEIKRNQQLGEQILRLR